MLCKICTTPCTNLPRRKKHSISRWQVGITVFVIYFEKFIQHTRTLCIFFLSVSFYYDLLLIYTASARFRSRNQKELRKRVRIFYLTNNIIIQAWKTCTKLSGRIANCPTITSLNWRVSTRSHWNRPKRKPRCCANVCSRFRKFANTDPTNDWPWNSLWLTIRWEMLLYCFTYFYLLT